MDKVYSFNTIGQVTSPYKEKFAIPRQPGIVTAARGKITLVEQLNNAEIIRGLEQFSHIWVLFVFHATQQQGWKPLVRPPRLGGNKKLGVLATRSTFRPNPIGMSVVKLDGIEHKPNSIELHISGLDLLDQTPVIDIKPYVGYSDSLENTESGFAQLAPSQLMNVNYTESAKNDLQKAIKTEPDIESLLPQILAQDPRPAYKRTSIDDKVYGMRLFNFNIKWQLTSLTAIKVIEIK